MFRFGFTLIVSAFAVYVGVFNHDMVDVHLPGIGQFTVWSAIAFVGFFLSGAVLTSVYYWFELWTLKRQLRRQDRERVGQSV